MRPISLTLVSIVLVVVSAPLRANDAQDSAMKALAESAGCFVCHAIDDSGRRPDAPRPVGPFWRDVARRYAGEVTAGRRLVPIVMQGGSATERHWKGKAAGVAMPANEVILGEPDISRLVNWILALPP